MNSEKRIPFAQKKLLSNWLALRLDVNGATEGISPRASPDSESSPNPGSPGTFDEVISLVNEGQAIGARYLFSDGSFEDYDKKLLLAHFPTLGFLPA